MSKVVRMKSSGLKKMMTSLIGGAVFGFEVNGVTPTIRHQVMLEIFFKFDNSLS